MMRRPAAVLALVMLTLGASSCRHQRTSAPGPTGKVSIITRADMDRVRAKTALDAVQRLRSDVLTPRAPSSILAQKRIYPVVFLNDTYLGQIDELRQMPADGIEEIRIHNGVDATTKFGSQYGGGVIQIISRTS